MKAKICKLYGKWVVEFPFAVVVYCETWQSAIEVLSESDRYLLATENA